MSQTQIKDSDMPVLIAAIQNAVSPIQVDAEKVARQLGMSLSTIPSKFTAIRKQYNIKIKVTNSGALYRNRGMSPKKKKKSTLPAPKKSKAEPKTPVMLNSMEWEAQHDSAS